MGILENQLRDLRDRYPALEATRLGSGTHLISISGVPLPQGWTKTATDVRFLVPAAYPFAALDCFWADDDLRLTDGRLPQNSAAGNVPPEATAPGLWFSWHLTQPWNPNRDTLSSWMNTINDRLRRPL
jgi:hypothetical protein